MNLRLSWLIVYIYLNTRIQCIHIHMWDMDNIMFGTFVCSSTKEEPSLDSAFLGQVESTLCIWSFHRVQLPHAAQLPRFLYQDALCDPWSPLFHGCPSMSLLWSLGNRQAFQATCEINWTKEKKRKAQHLRRSSMSNGAGPLKRRISSHSALTCSKESLERPWTTHTIDQQTLHGVWNLKNIQSVCSWSLWWNTHIATKWKSSVHMT